MSKVSALRKRVGAARAPEATSSLRGKSHASCATQALNRGSLAHA
eukprot:CAMPEP_0114134016 /NCGR_PEP_ID=MMETSP0043_2-20121206/13932_1 /TAXON_ID=464988 /ORGANISM="Hemiselmis andersenii, Strain CCMP644" /LENGTH=44 /DNA_ID= /DNA_START= /DNA_END= /DNA_ORIENTATION=